MLQGTARAALAASAQGSRCQRRRGRHWKHTTKAAIGRQRLLAVASGTCCLSGRRSRLSRAHSKAAATSMRQ